MKKLTLTLITIISLCSANISEGATRYVTVIKEAANGTFPVVTITANEVAFIHFIYKSDGQNAYLSLTKDGVTLGMHTIGSYLHDGMSNLPIAGPATFTVTSAATDNTIWATIRIEPNPQINSVGQ